MLCTTRYSWSLNIFVGNILINHFILHLNLRVISSLIAGELNIPSCTAMTETSYEAPASRFCSLIVVAPPVNNSTTSELPILLYITTKSLCSLLRPLARSESWTWPQQNYQHFGSRLLVLARHLSAGKWVNTLRNFSWCNTCLNTCCHWYCCWFTEEAVTDCEQCYVIIVPHLQ